ncbi:MAG: hypothetical protein LBQ05_02830, partial [Christensenellaceae bacterium]|nr:hypothetical protein [Christensenellaceae bacterium]
LLCCCVAVLLCCCVAVLLCCCVAHTEIIHFFVGEVKLFVVIFAITLGILDLIFQFLSGLRIRVCGWIFVYRTPDTNFGDASEVNNELK